MDISEFLFNSIKGKNLSVSDRIFDKWERLKDYYGQVPKEIERRFIEKSWNRDYILENLQTHDWESLAKRLQPLFGSNFLSSDSFLEGGDERRTFYIRLKGSKMHPFIQLRDWAESIIASAEVEHLLEFYNYRFREIRDGGDSTLYFWFEPIFTESANDYVFGKCHGVVYHITDKEHLQKILKSGLRCKTGENGGPEKWPSRIYFWAHEPQKFSQTKQDLKDFTLNDLYSDREPPVDWKQDIAIIRFRLWPGSGGRNGIPVYRDTAMNKNAFFTYTNVPVQDLDKVVKYPGQE